MKKILRLIPLLIMAITIIGCSLSEQEEREREQMEIVTRNYMKDFIAENYKNATIKDVEAVTYIEQFDKELSDFVEVTIKKGTKLDKLYYNTVESKVYINDNVDKLKEELVEKVYTLTDLDKAKFENVELGHTVARANVGVELIEYDIDTLDKLIEQSNSNAGYTLNVSLTYKNSGIDSKKLDVTELYENISYIKLNIYDVNNNFEKTENNIDDNINEFSHYTDYTLNSSAKFEYLDNQITLEYRKYKAESLNGVTIVYNPDYLDVELSKNSKINNIPVVSYDAEDYKSLNKGLKLRFVLIKPLNSLENVDDTYLNFVQDIKGIKVYENVSFPYIYFDKAHYKESVNIPESKLLWNINNVHEEDNGHVLSLSLSDFINNECTKTVAFYEKIEE